MNKPEQVITYETRIVAFVDILGFKKIIRDSEHDPTKLNLIYQSLEYLKKTKDISNWSLDLIEIEEDAQKKGLEKFDISESVRVSCFSDTIVVSVATDGKNINEMFSTLVANLTIIGAILMNNNIILRGAMTIGNLFHGENEVIMGQALIDAYELENTVAKYPRTIISNKLLAELNYPLEAKRNRYPYHQYLERFDDGCVGFHQIIYYQVLQSWVHMSNAKLLIDIEHVRKIIIAGLDSSYEHPDIYQKYLWLKEAYNRLIILHPVIKRPIPDVRDNPRSHNIHHLG